MEHQPQDIRCKSCGALLAQIDDGCLSIRRGKFQISVYGNLRASLVCYQRDCGRLNVVRLPDEKTRLAA